RSRVGRGLDGKVALVTGAGSRAEGIGNGRAAAVLLAREGVRVGLLDAVPEWAAETLRMIEADGGRAKVVVADVTDSDACAAAVGTTRAMAAHHGPAGIRVNAIAPGMVYTPMVYSRGMSEELREKRRRRSLLQTEGTGWDVGRAVVYLASDDARWVTGIVLPV